MLVLKNSEQQTAGSANLMSLQCWGATLKMVVVEYFMPTSEYKNPNQLLVNASTASPNKSVRLRQLYDNDYWNKYSRSKCYAPLVKWEEFLCNAPREVILVHIAYQVPIRVCRAVHPTLNITIFLMLMALRYIGRSALRQVGGIQQELSTV